MVLSSCKEPTVELSSYGLVFKVISRILVWYWAQSEEFEMVLSSCKEPRVIPRSLENK